MLADTAAIDHFGAAQAKHAADLDALGARLAGVTALLTSDGLGSVGTRFVAAMCDAVNRDVRAAHALGDTVTACATTARHTASAYAVTEVSAGQRISTLAL